MLTNKETLESLDKIKESINHVKDNVESQMVKQCLDEMKIDLEVTKDTVNNIETNRQKHRS